MNRRLLVAPALVICALASLLACGARPAASQSAVTYTIGQIGSDANNIHHVAGITNSGLAAGSDLTLYAPWRWTPSGGVTVLPTFGTRGQGGVRAVNELGACVGYASNNAFVRKPAYWSPSGSISNLNAGRFSYWASGLNDASSGTIAGAEGGDPLGGTPVYHQAGKWKTLPTLGGTGGALGVDNLNQIVGVCSAGSAQHVALWRINAQGVYQVTDLTAGYGLVSPVYPDSAKPVIRAGRVASMGKILDLATGVVTDLTAISGFTGVRVYGINSSGQAVGTYSVATPSGIAAFYFDGSAVVDLNDIVADSGWTLLDATGINDNGKIAGMGDAEGTRRAYVLDLTP